MLQKGVISATSLPMTKTLALFEKVVFFSEKKNCEEVKQIISRCIPGPKSCVNTAVVQCHQQQVWGGKASFCPWMWCRCHCQQKLTNQLQPSAAKGEKTEGLAESRANQSDKKHFTYLCKFHKLAQGVLWHPYITLVLHLN